MARRTVLSHEVLKNVQVSYTGNTGDDLPPMRCWFQTFKNSQRGLYFILNVILIISKNESMSATLWHAQVKLVRRSLLILQFSLLGINIDLQG